ncbi:MAG: zinc ribbon domain-containing protein [Methanobrevibacter sp.]|nr:zinc ribbon domain-containing protein [Methanobrevibacter sp.]
MTKICPACATENSENEEYCLNCGQKLSEDITKDENQTEKLEIPEDKIILLDLNYTLISNSWAIRYEKLPEKIYKRQYEHRLIELIKNNYVILITASPYMTSYDSLKHIENNTDLKITESYWNFGKRPHELKRYWLEKAVIPTHGDDAERYLAIESNPKTREMYAEFGIEARPKGDFI